MIAIANSSISFWMVGQKEKHRASLHMHDGLMITANLYNTYNCTHYTRFIHIIVLIPCSLKSNIHLLLDLFLMINRIVKVSSSLKFLTTNLNARLGGCSFYPRVRSRSSARTMLEPHSQPCHNLHEPTRRSERECVSEQ